MCEWPERATSLGSIEYNSYASSSPPSPPLSLSLEVPPPRVLHRLFIVSPLARGIIDAPLEPAPRLPIRDIRRLGRVAPARRFATFGDSVILVAVRPRWVRDADVTQKRPRGRRVLDSSPYATHSGEARWRRPPSRAPTRGAPPPSRTSDRRSNPLWRGARAIGSPNPTQKQNRTSEKAAFAAAAAPSKKNRRVSSSAGRVAVVAADESRDAVPRTPPRGASSRPARRPSRVGSGRAARRTRPSLGSVASHARKTRSSAPGPRTSSPRRTRRPLLLFPISRVPASPRSTPSIPAIAATSSTHPRRLASTIAARAPAPRDPHLSRPVAVAARARRSRRRRRARGA